MSLNQTLGTTRRNLTKVRVVHVRIGIVRIGTPSLDDATLIVGYLVLIERTINSHTIGYIANLILPTEGHLQTAVAYTGQILQGSNLITEDKSDRWTVEDTRGLLVVVVDNTRQTTTEGTEVETQVEGLGSLPSYVHVRQVLQVETRHLLATHGGVTCFVPRLISIVINR